MEHTAQKISDSRGCNWFSKALFLNLLKRYFYIPVILFFEFVLSGPFVLYNTLTRVTLFYEEYADKLNRFYMDLEHVLLLLANPILFMAISIFVAVALFMFIYNQKTSYMMHAFPFQRKTIYCTTVVAAFLMILVPYIITAVIVTAMAGYGGALGVKACIISFVMGIGQLIFFLGLAVFVVMCTGQGVAAPILYFIVNFLWSGLYMIFTSIYESFLFGTGNTEFSDIFSPAIFLLSRGVGASLRRDYETWIYILEVKSVGYVFAILLVGIAFFVISYVIYKKKHIESVGSLLPLRWTRPVFRWGVAICVSSILGLFVTAIISFGISNRLLSLVVYMICFVLFGFMVFFGTAMLVAKSFKVFKWNMFKEYLLMLLACFLFLLASYTDVFGVEKRVPDMKDIAAIDIGFEGTWVSFDTEESYSMVEQLTQVHRDIVTDRKILGERTVLATRLRMEEVDFFNSYFNINYSLKNGKSLSRYYSLVYDVNEPEKLDTALSQAEKILNSKEALEKRILHNYNKNKDWWVYRVFVSNNANDDWKYSEDTAYSIDQAYYPFEERQWSSSDNETCEKIWAAFLKDVEAGNIGIISITDSEKAPIYNLEISFTTDEAKVYNGDDIYCGLTEDAVNTIAALKECGVDF